MDEILCLFIGGGMDGTSAPVKNGLDAVQIEVWQDSTTFERNELYVRNPFDPTQFVLSTLDPESDERITVLTTPYPHKSFELEAM